MAFNNVGIREKKKKQKVKTVMEGGSMKMVVVEVEAG